MIQNSSAFSREADMEDKPRRKLLVSHNYEAVRFSNKKMRECGEVEVIKDFHIEITSNGESTILEYSRGEVFNLVRHLIKKYIHLGYSPSGLSIVSEINEDYFKVISK